MNLRQWLIERQQALRESDRTFARRLGVTGAFWGMVRRSEKGVSLRLARAARRAFPTDAPLIDFLAMQADDAELDQGDAA